MSISYKRLQLAVSFLKRLFLICLQFEIYGLLVALHRHYQHENKVLLDRSRNFCSFLDMDHLNTINKQTDVLVHYR